VTLRCRRVQLASDALVGEAGRSELAGQTASRFRGVAWRGRAGSMPAVADAVPVVAPHASRAGLSAFHGELRELPVAGLPCHGGQR
jgi:hypothetical protein